MLSGMSKSWALSLLCIQVTRHLATKLCHVLFRVSESRFFPPPILSPPSITLSYSLCVIPAVFPIKTHLDSRLLSSLELICASIYLLMKSPTHFSHRGIHSSPPVFCVNSQTLAQPAWRRGKSMHILGHIFGLNIFCIKPILSFIYHSPF